jgi:hypothetical protein
MLAAMRFGPVEVEPYLDSRSRAAEEIARAKRKQIAHERWLRRQAQR